MQNKTMIIKGSNEIFFSDIKDVYMYYRLDFVSRALKKIVTKLGANSFKKIFYGEWKHALNKYDSVILFDSEFDSKIPQYIKKKNPNIKIIFWYWNSVASHGGELIDVRCVDEVWTYDRFDAAKYNIKYNPQFYHKLPIGKSAKHEYDLFFLGKNKGRKKLLSRLASIAEKQNFNYDFHIVEKKHESIAYKEYLKMISDAKCIVDLVNISPCGLTLRPLEALFYEKKLITNNSDITNYDFYNKSNVFILGKDNINDLVKFIKTPTKKIKKEIIDRYSYDEWLKRIINDESESANV